MVQHNLISLYRRMILLLPIALTPLVAIGQTSAKITVDLSKPVNIFTAEAVGVYTQVGDEDLLSPQTLGMLHVAGVNTLTYPSGWNSVSATYHWSTNTITPKAGNTTASNSPYVAPSNDFGHFGLAMQKYGFSAIIHVNYGSNAKGTGGGDPKEAAAWVAYANGSPRDTKQIGTDSIGQNWKTVGFWASLRASARLATDDGYNFLRISHPSAFHIELWQIGDDIAENGYYGGDHKGTIDLHAPGPTSPNDNEHRRKLKELSPTFYGKQVIEFSAAMKAVDSSIKIGASVTTPTIDTWATDWNQSVLKTACADIDFVSFSWHPGSTLPPDWKILDDASALDAPITQLSQIFSEDLYEDKKSCPDGKRPRVVLSEFSPISWATMQTPIVPALFAAESYAALAEAGVSNASWFQLRDQSGLFDKDKPTAAYYGIQMLHIVAYSPGDVFVSTGGAGSSIVAFATKRQDGVVGILLANHDAKEAKQVWLTIIGGDLAGTGMRFEYAPAEQAKGSGPERSGIKSDGNSIEVTIPAYGIVDLLLGLKK